MIKYLCPFFGVYWWFRDSAQHEKRANAAIRVLARSSSGSEEGYSVSLAECDRELAAWDKFLAKGPTACVYIGVLLSCLALLGVGLGLLVALL